MDYTEIDNYIDKINWSTDDERFVLNLPVAQRSYLAKRISNYDGILVDLSMDREISVRLGVIENPNTPPRIIERLSLNDKDEIVRLAASRRLEENR
ncbi:MAG: hypothetical protein ABFD18_06070 [Syntrophomonas sp.]